MIRIVAEQTPSPYLLATFTLAGTLLGGLIGAVSQSINLRRQGRIAKDQVLHAERTAAYSSFMAATDRAVSVANRAATSDEAEKPSQSECLEVADQLMESRSRLALFASEELDDIALALMQNLLLELGAAVADREPPPMLPPEMNRRALRKLMQRELGLK